MCSPPMGSNDSRGGSSQMVAEFEKDIRAVIAPAAAAPPQPAAPEQEAEFDDEDIDEEAQQLLQEQEYFLIPAIACM